MVKTVCPFCNMEHEQCYVCDSNPVLQTYREQKKHSQNDSVCNKKDGVFETLNSQSSRPFLMYVSIALVIGILIGGLVFSMGYILHSNVSNVDDSHVSIFSIGKEMQKQKKDIEDLKVQVQYHNECLAKIVQSIEKMKKEINTLSNSENNANIQKLQSDVDELYQAIHIIAEAEKETMDKVNDHTIKIDDLESSIQTIINNTTIFNKKDNSKHIKYLLNYTFTT